MFVNQRLIAHEEPRSQTPLQLKFTLSRVRASIIPCAVSLKSVDHDRRTPGGGGFANRAGDKLVGSISRLDFFQ
jgi:hypothetical protein